MESPSSTDDIVSNTMFRVLEVMTSSLDQTPPLSSNNEQPNRENSSKIAVKKDSSSEIATKDRNTETAAKGLDQIPILYFNARLSDRKRSCEIAIKDGSSETAVKDSNSDIAIKDSSSEIAIKDSSSEIDVRDSSSETAVKDSNFDIAIKDSSSGMIVNCGSDMSDSSDSDVRECPDVASVLNQASTLSSNTELSDSKGSSEISVKDSISDIVVRDSNFDLDIKDSSSGMIVNCGSDMSDNSDLDVRNCCSEAIVDDQLRNLPRHQNRQCLSCQIAIALANRAETLSTSNEEPPYDLAIINGLAEIADSIHRQEEADDDQSDEVPGDLIMVSDFEENDVEASEVDVDPIGDVEDDFDADFLAMMADYLFLDDIEILSRAGSGDHSIFHDEEDNEEEF